MLDAGPVQLRGQLADAGLHEVGLPAGPGDRRRLFGDRDVIARAEVGRRDVGQRLVEAADGLVVLGEGADELADRAERAVHVALHDHLQRGPVDVLGEDDQRPVQPPGRLDRRHELLNVLDLLVGQQDRGGVQGGLHAFLVGDHVRRDPAVVDLDAVDDLHAHAGAVALLDLDDPVVPDGHERVGHDPPDPLVVVGGQRRDREHVGAPADLDRPALQLADDLGDRGLDAAAHPHRVGALVDDAQTLAHHRLSQHGRGRRPVSDRAVGLHRHFLDELGAHVGERLAQLDLARDRHPVVGDRRWARELFEHRIAALGAERHLDGIGEGVDPGLELPARIDVETQFLSHVLTP